ncbi:MAG: gliding motility-associated ABC transporter ATP-binding subunit GldA [Bacteroidetes bacterium]|nr:MAG: gliding motility-associated ABC transporter ATP-binding subunit GldA [Bacteroidota bacterium]
MSIVVQHLTKQYGQQLAVNNISFEVANTGITGFLGPNGAGKSTTMKMLTGFLAPDGGTAQVAGFNMATEAIKAKQHIGYLPESNALYTDMYVREYLQFVAKIYKIADRSKRVEQCLDEVGLAPEANKKIGQLSKGYKQRVGLAAALLHQPQVLILDEPTSGLDPNQIVDIRNLIKALGTTRTVLLSTHIMQEVEAICNHVIIISKGTLVANDDLQNLRQAAGTQALKVSFEEVLEPEWLRRLPGVSTVERIDNHNWLLTGSNPAELRRQVMQLAANQALNVASLQNTGGSLEEIFRQLTTSQGLETPA